MTFTAQLGTAQSQPGNLVPGIIGSSLDILALAGDLIIEIASSGAAQQTQTLSGHLVIEIVPTVLYTGPGSGLALSGVTTAQNMALLREGDSFRYTGPWAGVRGRTGWVRVLSRTIDSSGRLTFVLQFTPNTDPSVMQSQADSGGPRLVVPTRSNLARRMTNAEKNLNKLKSD